VRTVKVTDAKAKAVSADELRGDIDAEIKKGGTISYLVVKNRLLDENDNEVSSYPHPQTKAPIPVLVDKSISTDFALRR
jgi:hypothetical protein